MVTGKWRGHPMHLDGEVWRYSDNNQLVSDNPDRACGHCGKKSTPEGHDGCLGTLPGVENACCGHGDTRDAYVQYTVSGSRMEKRIWR